MTDYAKTFGVTRKVSRVEAKRLATEARNRKAESRRRKPSLAGLLTAALKS